VIQPGVGSSTAIKDVVNQLFNAVFRVSPHPAAFPLRSDLTFFGCIGQAPCFSAPGIIVWEHVSSKPEMASKA